MNIWVTLIVFKDSFACIVDNSCRRPTETGWNGWYMAVTKSGKNWEAHRGLKQQNVVISLVREKGERFLPSRVTRWIVVPFIVVRVLEEEAIEWLGGRNNEFSSWSGYPNGHQIKSFTSPYSLHSATFLSGSHSLFESVVHARILIWEVLFSQLFRWSFKQ